MQGNHEDSTHKNLEQSPKKKKYQHMSKEKVLADVQRTKVLKKRKKKKKKKKVEEEEAEVEEKEEG